MILLIVSLMFAADLPEVDPGLWQVDTKVTMDGKEYDPQKMIQDALAQVPEAQREQVKAMMKSMAKSQGFDVGSGLNKVCLTQKMIDQGHLAPDGDQDCDHNLTKKNNKSFALKFKCKDGTKGNGSFKIKSKRAYSGEMKITQKDSKKVDVTFNGKFLKTKCQ